MRYGRLNIMIGAAALVIGGIGGFMLGVTLESVLKDGAYSIPFARIFTRGGHTHGLIFAFYNLIVGVMVDRLNFSDKMKRATSILAALTLVMSIGLLLRGFTGGAMTFAPVGFLGGAIFIVSAVFIFIGVIKNPK